MTGPGRGSQFPHLRLDELLAELQGRLQDVRDTRDRVSALLQAVVGVGSEVELAAVLPRIAEAAVQLVGARYGALAVIGEDGGLAEFAVIAQPGALRGPARPFLSAPVQVGGTVYGNLCLTGKRGGGSFDAGSFDASDETLVRALAGAAGVAVDKARLYGRARRGQQWLQAIAEVTRRLLGDDPPGQVLTRITELVLEMSGADLVVLAVPAGHREHLIIEYAAGGAARQALGLTLPVAASASGRVMASGEPLSIEDFSADHRVAASARRRLDLGPAEVFPLGARGNVRGVLTAGRRPGSPPLSAAAVQMVTTFAAQAGLGLELAGHRRDAARKAVLTDRDRIARDLHDSVIQRLFATGMSLQSATGIMPDGPAASRVSQAVDALDTTVREIRSAIFTLQSHGAPAPPSLRIQVMDVADEMTQALGCAPALRLDARLDSRVPPEIAEHLVAALREALANAARHARASAVEVTAEAGGSLVLAVQDDGVGLGGSVRRSGVANLTERARSLGGSMTLGPAAGGGTRLEWRVPLP